MRPPAKATLKIEEIAFGGDGVARPEGRVWFVPGAAPGEEIDAEEVEARAGYIRGRIKAIHNPSPHRVTPPCRYYGDCGGCVYQHLAYEAQLEIKRDQVRQTLRRIGHFDQVEVFPMIPSPAHYGFRNRITVHCEGSRVGFYSRRGNRLVDIEECLLAEARVNERLKEFRTTHPKRGHRTIRASGVRSPFEQTNPAVALKLLETVIQESGSLQKRDMMVDAYCGSGFFTKPMSESGFSKVVGLDWSEPAIEAARSEATNRCVEYRCGNIESTLPPVLEEKPDLLLMDPPRDGVSRTVLNQIISSMIKSIFYVSCNPATFARDARRLVDGGFLLAKVVPFDMFPQTSEIELLGLFTAAHPRQDIQASEQ